MSNAQGEIATIKAQLYACLSGKYCDECGHDCNKAVLSDVHEALEGMEPIVHGVWEYYQNDEGKARWRCSNCGKLCRRNPHDKKRCSSCGAHMKCES